MPTPDPLAQADPRVAEAVVAVEDAMSALGSRVRVILRDAAGQVDENLQPFGLRILRMLERHGAQSAGQLSECLEVDPSSTSRQVRQLVDLRLVEVTASASDRRSRIVALTDYGHERLAAIGPSSRILMQRALSEWDLDDLQQFAAYLEHLTDATVPLPPAGADRS
ncbi:MarR family winged helix-turn-helix transcriptional regulator [Aeromicrobium sp. YIM 150415]|uniref:MarR family winged helix-turn-helix transcriptional regulator n=1 Tax=Aeromicrobium sp. YIM 150415 TaxID=2803912 RepID=UPI001F058698|nr:MarR family winged helix-turn-helix transcriptional regulator [Aeromicrobium sp. YIM 150415]